MPRKDSRSRRRARQFKAKHKFDHWALERAERIAGDYQAVGTVRLVDAAIQRSENL